MLSRLCFRIIIMISFALLIAITVRLAFLLSSFVIWGSLSRIRTGPFWMAKGYSLGEMSLGVVNM